MVSFDFDFAPINLHRFNLVSNKRRIKMEFLSGEVEFVGVPKSKAIKRFVQRELYGWLSGIRSATGINSGTYRVKFQKQGEGHTVLCEIEIRSAQKRWVGFQLESGVYQSLRHAVAALRPKHLQPSHA
jgi:hypothetical protein